MIKFAVVLFALFFLFHALGQECTKCPCHNCTYNKTGNYFQNCGGTGSYGLYPSGSKAIIYYTGCQPCTTDRWLGRLVSPDLTDWGFIAEGDVYCTSEKGEIISLDKLRAPLCKASGTYKVTTSRTLRPDPEGLVCGTLVVGDTFTLEKCDPSSVWCYGQAHSEACSGQKLCANCYGWMECSGI